MDPLSVLREFTIRGELDKIVRVGDDFKFRNEFTFPCNIETAYRSMQRNLYTLEALIFFVRNHHLKHTEYMQNARKHSLQPLVTFADRRALLDYLQGKVASSDAIEFVGPSAAAAAASASVKDGDEYRPEDPQFLSHQLSAATAANKGFSHLDVDDNDRSRDSETTDYISLVEATERPLRDRESILLCRNRDFCKVLQTAMERMERDAMKKKLESHQRTDGLVAKNRLRRPDERGGYGEDVDSGPKTKVMKGSKIGEGVPIILVPRASQTLITIYNVKEFLEDGVFISPDIKMKQMKGPKPDCVTVQKKFGRDRSKVVQAYEVRDKPSTLRSDDWDRVVAVFVLGKEWQFKEWPFKDHVEIFNKIMGFFMRFEDDSLESAKKVKQWNVKIISVSKNKRHQDRAAALEVWEKLENFVQSHSHP